MALYPWLESVLEEQYRPVCRLRKTERNEIVLLEQKERHGAYCETHLCRRFRRIPETAYTETQKYAGNFRGLQNLVTEHLFWKSILTV